MLQPIDQLNFSEGERLGIIFLHRFIAACPETGAMLFPTNGRPKGNNAPRYVLIKPNKSLEERGGLLSRYSWDYPHGRKFVRAWSDSEAIDLANKKLEKMHAATA